jgi:hypothetical protein
MADCPRFNCIYSLLKLKINTRNAVYGILRKNGKILKNSIMKISKATKVQFLSREEETLECFF